MREFAWLNFGYVLRLQVADSIPAQVSGSQSVSCVFAVLHPTLLSQTSSLFLVTGKLSAWNQQPRPFPVFFPFFPISVACLDPFLFIKVNQLPSLPFSPPPLFCSLLFTSLFTQTSDDCLETARRNLLIWQDVMLPETCSTGTGW